MMKLLRTLLVVLLTAAVLFAGACSANPNSDQVVNGFFNDLQDNDYQHASEYLDKLFSPEHTSANIESQEYLQSVANNLGDISEYEIVSRIKYSKGDVRCCEYTVNIIRNNHKHLETVVTEETDGIVKIASYQVSGPDNALINNLYNAIATQDVSKLDQLFSTYLEGYVGNASSFYQNINAKYGTLDNFTYDAAEYYYEDYSGAAMQASARFTITEDRSKFDAVSQITLGMGQNGLVVSDISYTPVVATQTMDSIMQYYRSDDYRSLETLYSASYMNTIGGGFNIHLDEIVLPIESDYGDITSFVIDDYTIFSLEMEDEQAIPAIRVNYTVNYEFGTLQEQITLAQEDGSMKIYIHYIQIA